MIRVESTTRSPSRSRTGSAPSPHENSIAHGGPDASERRSWGIRFRSSAQRTLSLKFENAYCQRTDRGDGHCAAISHQ
jgi:hypothetical protein